VFNRVDDDTLESLRQVVGPDNILTGADALEPYRHDETAGLQAEPEAVVWAHSAAEVSAVLQLAQGRRIPVTPRGAGTGLSGGAVPVCGGIVLSLARMNRILEIDHDNLMVTVEPGVITADLHRAVEAEGLFYPPDPASLDSCSIGGNVAEGAGGAPLVEIMRRIKAAFDRNGILNPGKMFE
jgi:glycolate oxidase